MQLCRIFCNKKTKSTKDKQITENANDYEFTPIVLGLGNDEENQSSEVVDDVGSAEMSSGRALVLPSFATGAAPEF